MLKWQFVSTLGLGLAMALGTTQAATINWTGGGANNSWVDPVNWGGNAVTAGNTYVVSGTTISVRDDLTFDGDLLRMQNFNAVIFTAGNSFSGNFELNNGGTIRHNQSGTISVDGSLNFGNLIGTVEANGSGTRIIELNALITGTGTARIGGNGSEDGVIISNASNSFNGIWETHNAGFFRTTVQGSLGTGDIIVDSGLFDAEYNLNATSNSLTMTGGTYELETFNHTYAENGVVIGTVTLPPGIYDITSLNTLAVVEGLSPTSFTGTTGTLTVVPEPASLVLLSAGSLLILSRRHK